MSVDVVQLKPALATRDGSVSVKLGKARLFGGASGTLTYTNIAPTKFTRWRSAEVVNLIDPSVDSIRIRLTNGVKQYYISETMSIEEVTDTSQWDTEFSAPWLLGNLDLWTAPSLQIIVHLVQTDSDSNPTVGDIRVLLDNPTWEGAIAQAVRDVATFVSNIHPILLHVETVSGPRSTWKMGKPHTEHGYVLQDILQVVVDNDHKSSSLTDGTVTLTGPAAPAGSTIEIAVTYKPTTTVRRVDEVRKNHETPAWVIKDLVVDGGLIGVLPDFIIGGQEIKERLVELTITVMGMAHRQADALAMRLALQQGFADGMVVTFPSGRCAFAQLDGLVEVVEEGPLNLPMAIGTVALSIREYIFSKTIRNQRDGDSPVTTEISLELPDGYEPTFDDNGFNC